MAWKGLHLSRPSRLSTADGQIVVAQDDGEARVALEDVAYVVLDTRAGDADRDAAFGLHGSGRRHHGHRRRHMPSGLLLPFHVHHRQAGVAALQIGAERAISQKRCWQTIVVAKIDNQAAHLERRGG